LLKKERLIAMAVPIRKPDAAVYIDGRHVVIANLAIDEPDLVQLVSDAEDPVKAVHEVAAVGARVVRMTQTTVDAAVVERRFGMLEQRVDDSLKKAVELIGETAAAYLDPEKGALKVILDELEKNLGDAFDPDSKASVLAKFEGLLTGGTADIKKVVRDLVDPGSPESPLGRLKHDLSEEMKELRQIVNDLRTQVAVAQTEVNVLELTAIKGRRYEEVVFEAVAGVASLLGDEAEPVGDQNGTDANRCGDILVTLNSDATPVATGRIAVEVKDRKLSLRETHAELERAMKNRAATAGVIVFSRQEKAPIATPLQMLGSKVVVVLDKDELDERALRLGIAAARCVVQRHLNSTTGKTADVEAALALIEEGQRALVARSTVKRFLTTAQRQITSAGDSVEELVDKLDDILRQIAGKLRS
jgi:hypothetical protein